MKKIKFSREEAVIQFGNAVVEEAERQRAMVCDCPLWEDDNGEIAAYLYRAEGYLAGKADGARKPIDVKKFVTGFIDIAADNDHLCEKFNELASEFGLHYDDDDDTNQTGAVFATFFSAMTKKCIEDQIRGLLANGTLAKEYRAI